MLAKRIPLGMHLLHSTMDGNCLFTSASVALIGDTSLGALFRLCSVSFAVEHFDHLLDMVCCYNNYVVSELQYTLFCCSTSRTSMILGWLLSFSPVFVPKRGLPIVPKPTLVPRISWSMH